MRTGEVATIPPTRTVSPGTRTSRWAVSPSTLTCLSSTTSAVAGSHFTPWTAAAETPESTHRPPDHSHAACAATSGVTVTFLPR